MPLSFSLGVPFPKNFQQVCKKILSRLFRVFVHVYIHHFDSICSMGAEAHINTCYKHYYYFITEFHLIDNSELEPLVSHPIGKGSLLRHNLEQRSWGHEGIAGGCQTWYVFKHTLQWTQQCSKLINGGMQYCNVFWSEMHTFSERTSWMLLHSHPEPSCILHTKRTPCPHPYWTSHAALLVFVLFSVIGWESVNVVIFAILLQCCNSYICICIQWTPDFHGSYVWVSVNHENKTNVECGPEKA